MTAPTSAVRLLEAARGLIQRGYSPEWHGTAAIGGKMYPASSTDPEAKWTVTGALMVVADEGGCFVKRPVLVFFYVRMKDKRLTVVSPAVAR